MLALAMWLAMCGRRQGQCGFADVCNVDTFVDTSLPDHALLCLVIALAGSSSTNAAPLRSAGSLPGASSASQPG